jgi:hypothetical protein
MLLATVGAGLFWASALGAMIVDSVGVIHELPLPYAPTEHRGLRLAGTLAAILLIIASVAISAVFLSARRDDFLRVGAYTDRLMALSAALPIEESGLLLFNAPNYIAPEEPTFLMGTEGAAVMLDIINYEQQIWLNTGKDYPPVRPYTVAATRRHTGEVYSSTANQVEGGKLYNRFRRNPGWYVIATQFADGDFWPVVVGQVGAPGPDTPIAVFPDIDHALTQADAVYSPARGIVTVRTRWLSNTKPAVKLFVHVWCNGELIGQSDGYPWLDMYPFAAWRPGELETDSREIVLNRPVDAACLEIYTGLYWEATVERLHRKTPTRVRYTSTGMCLCRWWM